MFIWVLQALPFNTAGQCVRDGSVQCTGCKLCTHPLRVKGRNILDSTNRKQPFQNNQLNLNSDGTSPKVKLVEVTDEGSRRRNYREPIYVDYPNGDEVVKKDKTKTNGVLDGIYVKELTATRPSCRLMHYSYLTSPDLMWEKRVWRKIEQGGIINDMYFENHYSNKQLWQVIVDGLRKSPDSLKAYGYYDTIGAIFSNPLSKSFAYGALERRIPHAWILVEDWYFDKVRSVMDVKIIGICPVVPGLQMNEELKLFWLYFPQLEPMLKHAKINMPHGMVNDYYELFWKRMFNSTIIKETNVYQKSAMEEIPASPKN